MKKTRIQNAKKYLEGFLKYEEEFKVGLLFEDLIKFENIEQYGPFKTFVDGKSITPNPIRSATKYNVKGKFGRVEPEEKEEKKVHIKYIRKDTKTKVEFDRIFNVWKKELKHKFNISLEFHINENGQEVLTSETLIFNDDNNLKNTQAINIFCEIFNDFEIFTNRNIPAIHFNKRFELELLPQGKLDAEQINTVLEITGHYARNEEEKKAFEKRFDTILNFEPQLKGKGPSDFFGYLVFGFESLGIVILETMYSGHATYVFKYEDYEKNIIKDKQEAQKSKQLIRRFFHYDNWEYNITKYLNELIKSKK